MSIPKDHDWLIMDWLCVGNLIAALEQAEKKGLEKFIYRGEEISIYYAKALVEEGEKRVAEKRAKPKGIK